MGGTHRGRRFTFPADESVRPTPDRVRETLFNWMQPVIAGARCLDLFAGSGALGLEAISRGAAHVEFVDAAPSVVRAIREHLTVLGEVSKATAHAMDVAAFLRSSPRERFDVVFLDPPYAAGLLVDACMRLEGGGWLLPQARVYLEYAAQDGLPALPENWRCIRQQRAGQVGYALALRG